MINAIIPIPARYPVGYMLGGGFRVDGKRLGVSGRTIKVLPLYFYKFFSTYGNASYQHIFASDTAIDPVTLGKAKNQFNSQNDYYGGLFVPISVKRLDEFGCATFLFCRCINFLIQCYRQGVPLDEVDALNCGHYSELSPGCDGVAGISEFNFYYMQNFMNNNSWVGFNNADRLIMSAMTPELPATISDYVYEIEITHLYGDALVQYISDLSDYESGKAFDLRDFLENRKFNYPIDPITRLCICTPSYLYGHQLRSFLGNEMNLSGFSRIGYNPMDNDFTRSAINLKFELADPYTWSDEIMESLVNMADEDFRFVLTNSGPVMEGFSIIGSRAPSIIDSLYRAIRNNLQKYSKIEVVKNWSDEVFMTVWDSNGSFHTYYINLAWYHLMSPSLVNMNLVRQ